MHRALAQVDEAFADAPRPRNGALLHERCLDDNDIVRLYPVERWREMPDELVESEYAALSFLSPDGFRPFIPAYMGFTLRHLARGAVAVDSTIWSLAPVFYEDAARGRDRLPRAVRELGDDYLAGQAGKGSPGGGTR